MKNLSLVAALMVMQSVSVYGQFEFNSKGGNQAAGKNGAKNSFELVTPSENSDAPQRPEPTGRLGAPQQPLGAPQRPVEEEAPLGAPVRPSDEISDADAENGPFETFVYLSDVGSWKVSPADVAPGRARYVWPDDGTSHSDRLYYLGFGNVIENEGFGVRRGTRVASWAYESQGADGNSIYFYFGVRPIRPNPRGTGAVEVYPMYYSFDPPGQGAQPRRLLTESGTTRY